MNGDDDLNNQLHHQDDQDDDDQDNNNDGAPNSPSKGSPGDDKKKPEKRAGRRKINIEFIEDKSRRHITFSKRKAGIMKKAYELSTLTGTQVLLLVASETGHVYTFATPKLQPLITKPEGKNLIQSCLNAPDEPPAHHQQGGHSQGNSHHQQPSPPAQHHPGPQTPQMQPPPPPPHHHHQQQHQQQQGGYPDYDTGRDMKRMKTELKQPGNFPVDLNNLYGGQHGGMGGSPNSGLGDSQGLPGHYMGLPTSSQLAGYGMGQNMGRQMPSASPMMPHSMLLGSQGSQRMVSPVGNGNPGSGVGPSQLSLQGLTPQQLQALQQSSLPN